MIRDIEKFNKMRPCNADEIFEWDFLYGAFGPSIMPMDLDAVVERNGRFFVFETKSSEGVSIPYGQQRSLREMVKTGFFTIMVLYGKTAKTITSYTIWHGNQERIVRPANAESVYECCAQWYEWVNGLSSPEYPNQLQSIIAGLRAENSQLRASLNQANSRIQVLTEYANRLERSFKLEAPKQKNINKKSMSLALGLSA